ncbi:hypothetical protein B2J93_6040 [Marssonina coronariae]|uniref:Uncharacterized protein n=1 Tax=Diplocarpon coronariae TaxID=2795749 RepID=A0A218YZ32_9HELO|nr:hypothetical protein B2J93_6040 [Marssonina coronariae]
MRLFPQSYHLFPAIERDLPFEIRSVYRGLLRATSYLPDSVARQYAKERIKARFRTSRAKASTKTVRKIHGIPREIEPATGHTIAPSRRLANDRKELDAFSVQRLKKARSTRTMLEKASDGDTDALVKVFRFVYGRQGERKRALLKDLLRPEDDSPGNTSAIQHLVETGSPKKGYRPDAKLYRFIRDQQENQPSEAHKGKIRRVKPKIPEETLWGRPMALKMQESMVKKWWASTLERLLPPIPRNEWERLRDLAMGAMPLEEPPRRRIPAFSQSPALDKETAKTMTTQQILNYFRMPARVPTPDIDRVRFELDQGLVISPDATIKEIQSSRQKLRDRVLKSLGKGREHKFEDAVAPVKLDGTEALAENKKISPRSMRRVYAAIWSLTPTMAYDQVTKTWNIKWGGPKSQANAGVITKPSPRDMELFEGIEKFDPSFTVGNLPMPTAVKRGWKRRTVKSA